MARLTSIGFELDTLTSGVEITTHNLSGGVASTLSSTHAHGGTYSTVFTTSTNFSIDVAQFTSGGANVIYAKASFWFTGYPSANCVIFETGDSAASVGGAYMNSSGEIGVFYRNPSGTNVFGTNLTAAIGLNAWHTVEINVIASTANAQTITVKVDGVVVDTESGTQTFAAASLNWLVWGVFVIGSGGTIASMYVDDIAVNDNTGTLQNTWIGNETLAFVIPNGAGDSNTFATQVGGTAGSANNYTRVDAIPPNSGTTYNASNTVGQSDLFTVSAANIPPNNMITTVLVGGIFANITAADATTAFTFQIERASGSTITQSAAIIPDATTWSTNSPGANINAYPIVLYNDPTGLPWTLSTVATMQIGYTLTTAHTDAVGVTEVWAYIGYLPTSMSELQIQTHGASGGTGTVSTLNNTFSSGCTIGHTVIVLSQDNHGVINQVSGITDSLGTIYTRATSATDSSTVDGEMWYGVLTASGTNTVTVNYSNAVKCTTFIAEYSGLMTTSPFDVGTGSSGTTGTALSSGATATTAQANELVIGAAFGTGTAATHFTAGSGFTDYVEYNDGGISTDIDGIEDQTISTTGTQTATFTLSASGQWVCLVGTFKLLTFVQTPVGISTASDTTAGLNVIFGSPTTTGNGLFVAIFINGTPTPTISDADGNSYTMIENAYWGGNGAHGIWTWYASNIKGLSTNQVTVSITGSTGTGMSLIAAEISSRVLNSTVSLGVTSHSGASTAGTPTSGATATSSGQSVLAVGVAANIQGTTEVASGGYGDLYSTTNTTVIGLAVEALWLTGAGAQTATFSTSVTNWSAAVAVFNSNVLTSAYYAPTRIANKFVGPMAMRHNFRQPYQTVPMTAIAVAIQQSDLTNLGVG